jgi:hypothetical protein
MSRYVLPVVACWVTTAGEPDVTTREIERMTDGPSLDALAVPDALWLDAAFIAAVWRRVTYSEATILGETIAAIHAEIRARAGGVA